MARARRRLYADCPDACISDHDAPQHKADELAAGTALHALDVASRKRGGPQVRVVFVPVQMSLAFTPDRGWHYLEAPPAWWWDQQAQLLEDDLARPRLHLVPPLPPGSTSCRPGPGACRRAHDHASPRRAQTV